MHGFWKTWMQLWCWGVLAFGVVLTAAISPVLDGPARAFYDLVHWPLDRQSSFVETTRFTAGILGAVTIGWALTLLSAMAAAEHLPPAPASALWRGLSLATVIWFVVDSAASIAAGVPGNAISNTVFFAGFLVPIVGSGVLGGPVRQTAS
jgi:hypothetical protein